MPDLGDIEIQSGKAGTVTVSNTKATADLTKLKNFCPEIVKNDFPLPI